MDISHKYPYTNFEQLNIDFLLESVADHGNKITQLRTDLTAETAARTAEDTAIRADLQTEIDTRIRDVEILTEEDANITAFANQIQSDLNQEIADRAAADNTLQDNIDAEAAARSAADDAMADLFRADINDLIGDINTINSTLSAEEIQLFHLSYGQGGVLDCTEEEAPYISRAFDTGRRCMVQFPSGHWFERFTVFSTTGAQFAYFATANVQSINFLSGNIIELKHLDSDNTHTFTAKSFSINTEPTVIHITSSSNVPDDQATYTTTDDLWDVQFMDKNTYIELTCPGNYPTRYYTRSSSIISDVGSGSYSATFIFSYWDSSIRYDLEIALSKTDVTDPSTWTATITGRKTSFDTV